MVHLSHVAIMICSLVNASAGIVTNNMIASDTNGFVWIQLNGSVRTVNVMIALTINAGRIVVTCFTPYTNVFLNVCCAGMRAKLTCEK